MKTISENDNSPHIYIITKFEIFKRNALNFGIYFGIYTDIFFKHFFLNLKEAFAFYFQLSHVIIWRKTGTNCRQ